MAPTGVRRVEAAESDFRQNAAPLSLPIAVAADNIIDVELRGDPGCAITVLVEQVTVP